jgi:hypothetical protein
MAVYDVVIIGAGPVGENVARGGHCHRQRCAAPRPARSPRIRAMDEPGGRRRFDDRLWHAVPAFPTVSEVWLRLLETYGSPS